MIKLSDIFTNQEKKFRLRWKGSKVPRGAKVGNIPIAWTQHGIVRAREGIIIGYYDRTVEWGGVNSDIHEMVISCDAQVYNTDGKPCPTA